MGLFDWLGQALRSEQPIEIDFDRLPHLARVAFAAHCARCVQPLLMQRWPDVSDKTIDSLNNAITITEEAVLSGCMPATIESVNVAILIACGEALHLGQHDATRILATARNAVWSVEFGTSKSAVLCAEAFVMATLLQPQVRDELEAEFQALYRMAKRGKWVDNSPVPTGPWNHRH